MILWVWGLRKSMSLLQSVTMLMTVFIPTVFSLLPFSITVGPFESPSFLPFSMRIESFALSTRHPAFVAPVFGVWSLLVLVLVPAVFKQDKSNVEQIVDRNLEGPQRDIQQLKEDHERMKADLREQREHLAWMEDDTRAAFKEVNVSFPLRVKAGGIGFSFDLPQPCVTLHARPVGRLVRCGRWLKHHALRFRKWFLEKVVGIGSPG